MIITYSLLFLLVVGSFAFFTNRKDSVIMYFICGKHGSGKTTIMNAFNKDGKYILLDLGPTIRKQYAEYRKSGNFLSFSEWLDLNYRRDVNFVGKIVVNYLHNHKDKDKTIVIFGARSLSDILAISRVIKKKYKIVFLKADSNVLKQRYEKRENVVLSNKEWNEIIDNDNRIGLNKIESISDIILFNENGKINELIQQLSTYIK